MNYSIVYITESTILSTFIDTYGIGIYNVNFKFNISDNIKAVNFIDIIHGLTVVFEPFGRVINIIKALIFRYIVSKKIDFEGWNILNFRNL